VELASRIKAYTLFATHYFELTTLPEEYATVANVHLDAVEHGDSIVFLHALKEGPANQSYGLQVAGLAGIPRPVIRRARQRLRELENSAHQHADKGMAQLSLQLTPEPTADHPALEALENLQPDNISPRQALDELYRLKKMMKKD